MGAQKNPVTEDADRTSGCAIAAGQPWRIGGNCSAAGRWGNKSVPTKMAGGQVERTVRVMRAVPRWTRYGAPGLDGILPSGRVVGCLKRV